MYPTSALFPVILREPDLITFWPLTVVLEVLVTVPLELPSFFLAVRLTVTLVVPICYFSTKTLPEKYSLPIVSISYSTSQSYWESISAILSDAWLATSIILFW